MRHVLATLTCFSCSCLAQADWSAVATVARPPARTFASMTPGPTGQHMLLFGGGTRQGVSFGDTWDFDGSNWTQLFPPVSPSARTNHGMVMDLLHGRVLLFGGWFSLAALDDTWSWNGTTWQLLTPVHRPSPRMGPGMAFDLPRGRVVLFGGWAPVTNDTWEWDGVDWLQRLPATSPAPRGWPAMSASLTQGGIVLFGGYDGSYGTNETWEWNGVNWLQRLPANVPPARYSTSLTYDQQRGVHVLFGGWSSNSVPLNDTWEWNGADWTQRAPGSQPTARGYQAAEYDWSRQRVMMFGGETGSPFGITELQDTWEYLTTDVASAAQYGNACPGGLGDLTFAPTAGLPWMGDTVSLELGNLPPMSLPFLVYGLQRAQINLGPFGVPGCTQWLVPIASTLLVQSGSHASWSWTIPSSSAAIGVVFQVQGAALSAGGNNALGAAVSGAWELVIGAR